MASQVLTLPKASWGHPTSSTVNYNRQSVDSVALDSAFLSDSTTPNLNSFSIVSSSRTASLTVTLSIAGSADLSSAFETAGWIDIAYGEVSARLKIGRDVTQDTNRQYSWIVTNAQGEVHTDFRYTWELIEADITANSTPAHDVIMTLWDNAGTSPFPADPPAPTYEATQTIETPANTGSDAIGGWNRNSARYAVYIGTPRTAFASAFAPDSTLKYLEQFIIRRDRAGIIVFVGVSESGARTNTPVAPLSDAFLDRGEIFVETGSSLSNTLINNITLPFQGPDVFDPRKADRSPDRTEFYRLDFQNRTAVAFERFRARISAFSNVATRITFRIRAAETPDNTADITFEADSGTPEASVTVKEVTPSDTTAPTLSSVATTARGDKVVLVFNETLDSASVPAVGDFEILFRTRPTSEAVTNAVTAVSVVNNLVTLDLDFTFTATDSITISYTAGTNPIQDEAGNDAADLTTRTVSNNVPRNFLLRVETGTPEVSIQPISVDSFSFAAETGTPTALIQPISIDSFSFDIETGTPEIRIAPQELREGDVEFNIETGAPEVSISPSTSYDITFDAATGTPEASFSPGILTELSFEIASGSPTIPRMRLQTIRRTRARLRPSFNTGAPEVFIQVRSSGGSDPSEARDKISVGNHSVFFDSSFYVGREFPRVA